MYILSHMTNDMFSHMTGELDVPLNSNLKFTNGNAKLDGIHILSLPAGHSCPFANECLAKTVQNVNGKGYCVKDGPACQFRCFASTEEAMYPAVRKNRWHNFFLLKSHLKISLDSGYSLLERSMPNSKWGAPIRMHVSGDFFNQMYFDITLKYAKNHPRQLIYAYTKAIPFWVKRLNEIPDNFRLTASYGGTHDNLIAEHNLKYAKVVFTIDEAEKLGLEIDHDDSHAYDGNKSFALLIHGTQPAGTPAAKAWSTLKKEGISGYGNHKPMRGQIIAKSGGTPPMDVVQITA